MGVRNILWTITDSIGMGYGDVPFNDRPRGLLFRLKQDLNEFTAQDPTWSICNFGYSGATARQYYNRVKAIFLATPIDQRPTAVLFSIYSPNGIFPNGTFTPVRVTGPDSAYAIAQEAETFFQGYNVKFIPWFICLSLYGIGSAESIWVRDNVYYPAQTLWGPKLLQSIDVVQDPAVDLTTTGIQMLASLTLDATHPNATGYNLIQSGGSLGRGGSLKHRFNACAIAAGIQPVYNPRRSHAYVANWGASLEPWSGTGGFAISYLFELPPFPNTVNWTGVQLWMYGINGTPTAPTGVWFAVVNGGTAAAPTLDGGAPNWVAATGLLAPPAGSTAKPGVGPVCNIANVSAQGNAWYIAVRIQIPDDFVMASGGADGLFWDVSESANWPGVRQPFFQFADITGSPGTTSNWTGLGSGGPAIILKYTGLSSPVMQFGILGDSHAYGLTFNGSEYSGSSGFGGEIIRHLSSVGYDADLPISLTNLSQPGFTTAQTRDRLEAFESSALDIGGWLIQETSLNNRDGSNDITTAISTTMWTDTQAALTFASAETKLTIPVQGLGYDNGASGWYARLRAHESDVIGAVGAGNTAHAASTILNADGSYKAGRAAPDGLHATMAAQQELAAPLYAAVRAALVNRGLVA